MMMLAGIAKDCNLTPMPQDGGEYILMEQYEDGPQQWRCVGCKTFVDGHNGHIKSWHHLKMLFHQGIPTPWPWAQRMLLDKGWIELDPAAAAEDWLEEQRKMMQSAQPRPRIPGPPPGPPPGVGPHDDMVMPPPPPRKGAAAASAAEGSGVAAASAAALGHGGTASAAEGSGVAAASAAALGHGGTTLCLKSEIAALTVEIERHNSEVAGLVRGMGRMAVQIDEMTVQIERQAQVIERLIATFEQRCTKAATGAAAPAAAAAAGGCTAAAPGAAATAAAAAAGGCTKAAPAAAAPAAAAAAGGCTEAAHSSHSGRSTCRSGCCS